MGAPREISGARQTDADLQVAVAFYESARHELIERIGHRDQACFSFLAPPAHCFQQRW